MTLFPRSAALVLIGLLAFGTAAHAQFVWLDDKGVKQYSDMPPPASVPSNRILRGPGKGAAAKPAPAAAEAEASANSAASADAAASGDDKKSKGPMTAAEKNADFKKRKAEQEEKEKKIAQEAKQAADKAKNCERAREYQRTLDSGIRIATTDKNGDRSFMDDERRAREARETDRVVSECK